MDAKWILLSKTFWGIFLTVGAALAQQFGWTWFGIVQTDGARVFDLALQLAGAALALYGRFKAQGPVTLLPSGGAAPTPMTPGRLP
jgi:hypothetical protein